MDIVERLRGNADERLAGWQIVVIMTEAADEIERLRKVLNDIVLRGDVKVEEGLSHISIISKCLVDIIDMARSALQQKDVE